MRNSRDRSYSGVTEDAGPRYDAVLFASGSWHFKGSWYTAFGLWWHMVTHGRGSEGETGKWSGCQYSHMTWEHGVSSITTADAHTSAASSWLNWCPRQFKWTLQFWRKTKSGFCVCAITFRMSSTSRQPCSSWTAWSWWLKHHNPLKPKEPLIQQHSVLSQKTWILSSIVPCLGVLRQSSGWLN